MMILYIKAMPMQNRRWQEKELAQCLCWSDLTAANSNLPGDDTVATLKHLTWAYGHYLARRL